jgi:dGTPase
LTDAAGRGLAGPVPPSIRNYNELHDLELASFASIEAQCAALADDIAYDTHDIDDGRRSGLLRLEMLEDLALPGAILKGVRERYPGLDPVRAGHELMRRQITAMVENVIAEASARLARIAPSTPDAVRAAGEPIVAFSPAMVAKEKELKAFLYGHLYRHPEVMRVRADAEQVVKALFDAYYADPRAMPEGWREGLDRAEERIKARSVADFLAGMTDTSALKEHRRLFDHTPDLS